MAWEQVGNIRGPAGLGVPPGGTTTQVLSKRSSADNDTEWKDATAGPQGPPGPTGPPGIGEKWFTGSGAPAGATGIIGDWYLDSTTGDYYEKTGATAWTLRGNLRGPTGATGPPGPASTVPGPAGPEGPAGPQGLPGADGADSTVPGPAGPPGADGADGVGIPVGGTPGQVLGKAGADDYDTAWIDQTGGGAGGTLDSLTDVDVVPVADAQVLTYIGATSDWQPRPVPLITVDPATPSGGKDGDLWVQTTDAPWTPPADLPRGIVAWKNLGTGATTALPTAATGVEVTRLSAVPLKANRVYRFVAHSRANNVGSGVGNVRMVSATSPYPGTTLAFDSYCYCGSAPLYGSITVNIPFTVTADGNYDFPVLGISNIANSGLRLTSIYIEDIGPNRGQQ